MAGKKDLEELVKLVGETPGWTASNNASGHHTFTNDATKEVVVMSSTPSSARTLANAKAELRRKGWNEDMAAMARDEDRQARLAADKLKAEARMRAAEERAAQPTAPKALASPFRPPVIATTTHNMEVPVTDPEAAEALKAKLLSGLPSVFTLVKPEWADHALEKGPCRQRDVYDTDVVKLRKSMEKGRFYGNPADCLVFDEHGCLVNGQHRMYAVIDADEEALAEHYPEGVPFYVVRGFPSAHANIFDTGKSRSIKDTLDVDGLEKFGKDGAAVLRLIMNFDKGLPHAQWPKEIWLNDEFSEAAEGDLAGVVDHLPVGRRVYNRAKLNRIVGTACSFLIDRDNPGGGDGKPNEDFWKGVCFDLPLRPDDPRAALYKFLQNQFAQRVGGKDKRVKTVKTPILMGHVLRQYANWQLGAELEVSRFDEDWTLPPVWQPGMRWIGSRLTFPKRPTRIKSPE